MGPIGCLLGIVCQLVHMVVVVLALPFVLIAAIFGKGKDK